MRLQDAIKQSATKTAARPRYITSYAMGHRGYARFVCTSNDYYFYVVHATTGKPLAVPEESSYLQTLAYGCEDWLPLEVALQTWHDTYGAPRTATPHHTRP